MTHSLFLPAAYQVGTVVVVFALILSACSRNSEPAVQTPAPSAAIQSAQPSVAIPASDSAKSTMTASLKVTVSLSPAVAKRAAPNDVVFIFARAVHGPRMPLAIVRKQVSDLPTTIVLDDSMSMSPQMKLSSVPEVIVVARVSKSGTAGAQVGDLEGTSGPVKVDGRALAISIATVVSGK